MKKLFSLLAVLTLLVSCSQDSIEGQSNNSGCSNLPIDQENTILQKFINENNLSGFKKDPLGFYSKDVEIGNGAIIDTSGSILINLKVTPLNFSQLDSNNYSFVINYKNLPLGLKKALVNLKENGRIQVLLPSSLAYGCEGTKSIPSNTPIFYDISLIDTRCLDNPFQLELPEMEAFIRANNLTELKYESRLGLFYQVEGLGIGDFIKQNNKVEISYVIKLTNGKIVDNVTGGRTILVTFSSILPGFQFGIAKCKVGNKLKILIPSYLAWGCGSLSSIPQNSILYGEFQIISKQ